VRSKEKSKKSKLKEQTIAEALSREKTRQDSTLLLAQQAYRQEVNSYNTDIFFSNYYHLQSVRFELVTKALHLHCKRKKGKEE